MGAVRRRSETAVMTSHFSLMWTQWNIVYRLKRQSCGALNMEAAGDG
jgi:hypothetical protein